MFTNCKKRGISPVKIIFGGRNLFKKLKKNHLQGKRREKLRKRWIEKRQGTVCSKGDKSKKGNLNLRFIFIKGELYLRINTGISSEGDSVARDQASVGNKPVRVFLKSWRVLRAAFTFPLLGKSFARDFSPLRRVLVSGDWERVVRGLVPAPGVGSMDGQKPPGGADHPEKAEYKYPTQNCTNVQFC